jgi:hypothetical protein
MNWVSLLTGFRIFLLMIFAFALLCSERDWFGNSTMLTHEVLRNIENSAIIIYGIVYIIQLKLMVKQKDDALAVLKTRLLEYEK